MDNAIINLGDIDLEIYKCISESIITSTVIITNKQLEHILNKHQLVWDIEAVKEVLASPDYIFKDAKHSETGLVVKCVSDNAENILLVLKVNSNISKPNMCNSIISGWTINDARLNSYIRNKVILYKKP